MNRPTAWTRSAAVKSANCSRLKAEGTTIFVNSHLLGEVELICDRVVILQRGEVIRSGDIATLTRMQGLFLVGLAPGQEFPTEEVVKIGYPTNRSGELWEVSLVDGQTIDPVVDLLRRPRPELAAPRRKTANARRYVHCHGRGGRAWRGRPGEAGFLQRQEAASGGPMKALAIFKDSLREALDSKVLYATLGLSLLLVLLVGSVSFQPVPAEEALPFIVANQHFHEYSTGRGQSVLPRYMACKTDPDQIPETHGRTRTAGM